MKNNRSDRNQRKKPKWIMITVVIALFGVISWVAQFAVAKYYAIREEKGISVASALYFSSNMLIQREGAATEGEINQIAGKLQSIGADAYLDNMGRNIPIILNETVWYAGDVLFPVEIRNYNNSLLYNEKNLDIEYEIFFKMIGTPKGATYTVTDVKNNETKTLGSNGASFKFTGTLTGGSPVSDRYDVHINTQGHSVLYDEKPVVFVAAYPVGPDYVKNDEKQEFRMMGLIRGHQVPYQLDVSSHFQFMERNDYNSSKWEDSVNDQAALIYSISTGGDAVSRDSNSIKQPIYVSWDEQYLQISRNDSDYLYAVNQEQTESGQWLWKEGTKWTMKLLTLPNNRIDITFYKTESFMNDMKTGVANPMTLSRLQGLVGAGLTR